MTQKLILLRHGQSMWNKLDLFTGWVDVPLSEEGIEEAINAGQHIKDIPIHTVFVSSLIRSSMTAMLAMAQHSSGVVPVIRHPDSSKLEEWGQSHCEDKNNLTVPVIQAWQINERMYGDLQGLNKEATRKKYGAEQVHIWRRSYDTPPPNGESLKMTAERTLPYFEENIISTLDKGHNVLVSAHGNSLRSIIMKLDSLSTDEVLKLEIPTGKPIIYNYSNGSFSKGEKAS